MVEDFIFVTVGLTFTVVVLLESLITDTLVPLFFISGVRRTVLDARPVLVSDVVMNTDTFVAVLVIGFVMFAFGDAALVGIMNESLFANTFVGVLVKFGMFGAVLDTIVSLSDLATGADGETVSIDLFESSIASAFLP